MKKIRGYKRRLKQVEVWKLNNLDLDMNYLRENHRVHVKFQCYPWNGFSQNLISFPQPKGKMKKQIIEALLDIYENWKKQLENDDEPFYLKIWLFEPHFSDSQIVCAISDCLHFYDNTFYKPESIKSFDLRQYESISKKLINYKWDFYFCEHGLRENEYMEYSYKTEKEFLLGKREFENEIKKSYRITSIERDGRKEHLYMIKTGNVWIGNK